ncbi:M23 family metallopeptidase [Lysobacter claricitrinus]|uniref:M23 family metallopeptidase n=1 Tax=Lysobacter claricitrinus TaxID=3367728 RepID=UPI0037DB8E85
MARRVLIAPMLVLLAACAVSPRSASAPASAPARIATYLPPTASQGALVIGRTSADAHVRFAGRDVRVAPDGHFALGIARDAAGRMPVSIDTPGTSPTTIEIQILPRDWPIEHVDGVPPATVNPPPEIAARIQAEQARVAAVRTRDDERSDFLQHFEWPVPGRISGRFGNQRVYNGSAGAPHSGMDIAAAQGTPVHAPAAGTITFADPDLYLTGGTVVLDHGHGVSSNFLHLSRIDVRVGDHIEQGQVIGAVGATGRATGPHLHWGMNWFDVRIDPLLVLESATR